MRRLTDKQLMRVAKRNIMLMKPLREHKGVGVSSYTMFLMSFRGDKMTFAGLPLVQRGYRLGRIFQRLPDSVRGMLLAKAKAHPLMPLRVRVKKVRRVAPFASFVRSKFHDASFAKLPAFQRIKALAEMWRSIRRSAASA